MSRDFEDLIRDAAPVVPDPGDVRRLNRAMLKGQMVSHAHRRPVLATAAILALVMVMLGMVGELGSDHIELENKFTGEYSGNEYFVSGLRKQVIFNHEGFTEAENIESAFQSQLDEGVLLGVSGQFTDFGYDWLISRENEVAGERIIHSRMPAGLSNQISREYVDFIMLHYEDLESGLGEIPAPNPRRITMTFEGREYLLDYWRFVLPEYGPVELYRSWADD